MRVLGAAKVLPDGRFGVIADNDCVRLRRVARHSDNQRLVS